MKHILFSISVLAALAGAASGGSPAEAVNRDRAGVAAHGYDVVAYFTDNKPVKGSAQFTQEWMGARWQFASAEHRELFAKDPSRYAPQYGGYCAWAVGHHATADIDPAAWRIVDGKLYLNYSPGIQKKWEQDRAKWIGEADRNWPSLHR